MKKFKNLIYVMGLIAVAIVFPIFTGNINTNQIYAYSTDNNVSFEKVAFSNSDFNTYSSTVSLEKSPTNWNAVMKTSTATSGIINVGTGANQFPNNYTSYKLDAGDNPGKPNTEFDNKILMINSKTSADVEKSVSQGFTSASITLDEYNLFEVNVWVKTIKNANASIYLSGFEEKLNTADITNASFETINTNGNWNLYTFYVSTGFDKITTTIGLYLGATNTTLSTGVAFFDNISINKVSQEKFINDYQNDLLNTNRVNYISGVNVPRVLFIPSSLNLDFNDDLKGWNMIGEYNSNTMFAGVLNVSNDTEMENNGLNYLGSDKTFPNNKALILNSKTTGYVGYKSNSFNIPQYAIYKISLNVKCDNISGSANVSIVEDNTINEFYGLEEEDNFYEPKTTKLSISTNSSNKLKNDYQTLSFYISGHSLYDTKAHFELSLGNEETGASGLVAFDSITFETVTFEQFNSISTSTTIAKTTLTTTTSEPTITNGNFNSVEIGDYAVVSDSDFPIQFPIKPASWEQSTNETISNNIYGVANTNINYWNNTMDTLTNPKNPTVKGTTVNYLNDTNNILVISNPTKSYQTITSPTITANKDSYYTLAFNYLANNLDNDDSSILNIYIKDSNNTVIFEDKNVASDFWANYEITIRTEFYDTTLTIVLEVGTADDKVKGFVYLDNFTFETKTITAEEFQILAEKNDSHTIDLSNLGLKLKSDNADLFGIYTPLLFNTTNVTNDIAVGGIIEEENQFDIDFPDTHTDKVKNMLVIKNLTNGTYTLTSKNSLSLTANSYYKFTVYVKTFFDKPIVESENEDEKHIYGASFSIVGLEGAEVKEIKENVDFVQYTIYAFVEEAKSVQVQFGFTSDCYETLGNAYFDTFAFETTTETEYNQKEANNLVAKYTSVDPDAEKGAEEDTEEEKESDDEKDGVNIWIAVSSLVIVFAFFVAITGHYIRKIEIKKIKKSKEKSYSRNNSGLVRDYSIKLAEERRDDELADLNQDIESIERILANLEEENKKRLAEERKDKGKEITRKAEREFKAYAQTRTRMIKDIEKIKEKIKEIESDDHLILLQREIQMERKNNPEDEKQTAKTTETIENTKNTDNTKENQDKDNKD